MRTTRELLGERLAARREKAKLSVAELADKINKSRAWIYDVEGGKKNFTVDEYDKLLEGCEASPESIFAELDISTVPRDLYWMLESIVRSENKDLIFGLRTVLGAMSREARASPNVASGTLGAPPRGKKKKS